MGPEERGSIAQRVFSGLAGVALGPQEIAPREPLGFGGQRGTFLEVTTTGVGKNLQADLVLDLLVPAD